jgi:IPT/TIG domain/Ankyrin repeats (3 copies)
MSAANRSFSMENLPRQAMMSAPSSRQPSRPGSAGSNRNSFSADQQTSQQVANQLFGTPSRRPPPLIHKLVPAEGSITGGTEVTLLGNGFYQGLEVMFGDTEATTTTFWGEKCLNCITPPALQAGTVAVVFKHEHHQYSSLQQQSQTRHSLFTYIDDREVEMYRLALKTVGKQMQHPTEDPYSAAQQLLGGPSASFWSSSQGGYGGGRINHHQVVQAAQGVFNSLELETNMLTFLDYLDLGGTVRPSRLNTRGRTGDTLLHLASSLGLIRFVAGLLSRGANPNLMDKNGNTPLHLAAMNGYTNIIYRLRLAGSDHKIKNMRGFIPADFALSLRAYQAALIPRQRSVSSRIRSRRTSATSLEWDSDCHLESSDGSGGCDDDVPTRRSSTNSEPEIDEPKVVAFCPAQYMSAWRESLAAQILQFHESASWGIPNLNLPALPNLPDYNTYPMVRRVGSLFPQRPHSSESLTCTEPASPAAPPAYSELYPNQAPNVQDKEISIKKASALHAAVEAVLDHHFNAVGFRNRSRADVELKASREQEGQHKESARGLKTSVTQRYLLFIAVSELSPLA